MKWSLKIGEFAGIGVYVHATFLLIIAYVLLQSHWGLGATLATTGWEVLFILVLFFCVVLHEFGHALTAKHFGIKTRDITLLPIGGVARMEKMPDDPKEELLVALAGPSVNMVIATVIYAWLSLTNGFSQKLSVVDGSFIERLMVVNMILGVFNLLPAFPMDGGRVLRAILALRISYARATHIAAMVGQAMAFLFGFLGLYTSNPMLLFIAFFVWIGAAQESSMVQIRVALSGIPVQKAMITHFQKVSPSDSLKHVISLILDGFQHDFPVVEEEKVVGILTQKDILLAISQGGENSLVQDFMHRYFQTSRPGEMLDKAFERLQSGDCYTMPVTQEGILIGLITVDNVGEFIMIQGALGQKPLG